MKITVLVENTARCDTLGKAHGLSLYIETEKHRILFDAGPDGKLLLDNAAALGIDLKKVDTAFLSHGHYDHSGGFGAFLELNSSAKLYMHRLAPEGHWASENVGFRYIGLDPKIAEKYPDRIVLYDGVLDIDDELRLFSDVKTADFLSGSNGSLFEENSGGYICDRFLHESNLLIKNGTGHALIAGCAHRGIVNIIRRAEQLCGKTPDHVFSGFHLTNPGLGIDEPDSHVKNVGNELSSHSCQYYTGHCTGPHPFSVLKECLEGRLEYMSTGSEFII